MDLTYHNRGAKRDVAATGCEVHAVAAIVAASKQLNNCGRWSHKLLPGCGRDSLQWHWHGLETHFLLKVWCGYSSKVIQRQLCKLLHHHDHYLKHVQVASTIILIHIFSDDLSWTLKGSLMLDVVGMELPGEFEQSPARFLSKDRLSSFVLFFSLNVLGSHWMYVCDTCLYCICT